MTPINVFVIDHARTIGYSFLISFLVLGSVLVAGQNLGVWNLTGDIFGGISLGYFVGGSIAVVVLEEMAHKNKLRNPFAKTA